MCTVYAAKMMVPRKSGLIVNISSAGGLAYLFNVAYGIGKEAVSLWCPHILCYVESSVHLMPVLAVLSVSSVDQQKS